VTVSYNGWNAGTRETAKVVVRTVPGTNVALPLNRDAADLLVWVAEQFHETVEPLHSGWCWGWADRLVRGSTKVSNHASGTAIDLNAPKHPLGKKGTFTASQERRIRAIVAKAGAVTWGGDYQQRTDEMHFEISDVAALHEGGLGAGPPSSDGAAPDPDPPGAASPRVRGADRPLGPPHPWPVPLDRADEGDADRARQGPLPGRGVTQPQQIRFTAPCPSGHPDAAWTCHPPHTQAVKPDHYTVTCRSCRTEKETP
jgi:hypothetical protein